MFGIDPTICICTYVYVHVHVVYVCIYIYIGDIMKWPRTFESHSPAFFF